MSGVGGKPVHASLDPAVGFGDYVVLRNHRPSGDRGGDPRLSPTLSGDKPRPPDPPVRAAAYTQPCGPDPPPSRASKRTRRLRPSAAVLGVL